MYTRKQMREKMDRLEMEVAFAALRGNDLVPNDYDLPRIEEAAKQIYDLSHGRNEVRFDRLGRPNIMVNIPNGDEARLGYLSAGGTIFSDSDWGSGDSATYKRNVHPAFVVNGEVVNGLRIGKYPAVRHNGKNYLVSLPGLDPACGTGGFNCSYNGIIGECDRVNAGTARDDGDYMHSLSTAEFGFLGVLAARKGFECRGNDAYGASNRVSSEHGALAKYLYQGLFVNTKTGSGPDSWRHDGSCFGIADLRGNVGVLTLGYQTLGGRLLYIPDNDVAGFAASLQMQEKLSEASDAYKALKMDGSWLSMSTADPCMCYDCTKDYAGASTAAPFVIATDVQFPMTGSTYGSNNLASLGVRDGVTIPLFMRLVLDAPLLKGTPQGAHYMNNNVNVRRVACRGGSWNFSSGAGFSSADGSYWSFDNTNGRIGGARPASFW